MTASQLRHRVTLTQIVRGRDAMGGVSESVGSEVGVWASVEPISADERFDMGSLSVRPTHRIMIRHRTGVTHRMRLSFAGRAFDVVEVRDADLRNRFLTLLCVAQEAGAMQAPSASVRARLTVSGDTRVTEGGDRRVTQ